MEDKWRCPKCGRELFRVYFQDERAYWRCMMCDIVFEINEYRYQAGRLLPLSGQELNNQEKHLIVPGRPIPAARMTRKGKWIKKQAQKYLAFRAQVKSEAEKCFSEPWDGPVGVAMWFYVKVNRTRGDGDNLMKAVLDGLNKVAYYDDRQVVEGHFYILNGEPQRTEVAIWKLTPDGGCVERKAGG